jgi:hypothetical protein
VRTGAAAFIVALLSSAEALAQPKQMPDRPWPWFENRVALSNGYGTGGGTVDTARGSVPAELFGAWFALSYDHHLARGFAVGLSPRIGVPLESEENLALLDLNAIARLRFPAFRPKPSAWYVGIAAGPSRNLDVSPAERRAFTSHVRPRWGYDLGIAGGIEILARGGWGGCFEIAFVRHAFTNHYTYDIESDGSRLEEDRRYALYELIGTVGVLRGF